MREGNNDRRSVVGALVVVVAAMAVLLVGVVRERFSEGPGVTASRARRAMGDVGLEEVGGGRWRLAEHRGQVVAINLWATWCGPCREETPMMVRLVRELGPRGFAVVGVSLDEGDRTGKVRAFAERFEVNYPLAFPEAMSQMSVGLEGIPTTILVDRAGRVAKTYVGEVRESVLRADVGTLLGEAGEATGDR